MQDVLKIQTLPSPVIAKGDEQVGKFVSRKALALIIYLALNPGNRSREELADLLWSDQSQHRAMGNLRVVLSDIRKKLGAFMAVDRYSVSLSIGGRIWVDVHELENAIERKNLDRAVFLYKGDFLDSFFLRGASRFENWQVIERERIRLALVDGLLEIIDRLNKGGNSKKAIKYLKHLLALEPLLESAHRQLMQAYFENGETHLALRQFEICQQVLSDELAVTPTEETQNLYSYIARQRSSKGTVSTTPHNLPNFTTPFIGQAEKSRELFDLVTSPEVRHLSLIGPGGYGKTRLAIHLGKKCLDQFPDGVFWVPLQSVQKGSDLASAIGDAIGFKHQSAGDLKNDLLDYLRPRQILLVLDNFEHLATESSLIAEVLTAAQDLKVIVTSRQRVDLKGEMTYIVSGLKFPEAEESILEKGSPERYDAIQLFMKSALRSHPSFKPKDEELQTISRICRSVDGMPLAIELAAGWVSVLPVIEIEAEIHKGFDFLATNLRDVEDRHRSLRAVAQQSWSLLSDSEKSVFMKLSIMKGPFARRAAERIAGTKLNELLSLSHKSFLQKDSEGLLRIHEWLRYFGERELARFPVQLSEAHELFAHYYVTYLTERRWEAWSGEIQNLRLEWTNITEALMAAGKAGEFQLLSKALVPFALASLVGASVGETCQVFAQIVSAFERRELSKAEEQTYALCLAHYAYYLASQGRQDQASEAYTRARTLIRNSPQNWEYAWVIMLENFSGSSTDVERMLENNKKALEIFARTHDDYAVTLTLNNLTNLSRGEAAKSFSQKALKIARKHNGTRDIAWALMRLGVLEMIYGDPAKAREYLSESNARYTSIQYSGGMAYSIQYLGLLAYRQSLYALAQQHFEQSLLISNRAGWISDTLLSRQLLGAVAFSTREYERARDLFLEATEIALRFTGDDLPDWLILPELARLLETLGNPRLAVISSVSTIRDLQAESAELWKPQLEEVLEDLKSKYAKAELAIWIEEGKQVHLIELVTAIRDALSGE